MMRRRRKNIARALLIKRSLLFYTATAIPKISSILTPLVDNTHYEKFGVTPDGQRSSDTEMAAGNLSYSDAESDTGFTSPHHGEL